MGIDVARFRIDIDQGRPGAGLANRGRGGDEGHRRRDHFGAGTHADREQRQAYGISAVGDRDHVPHAEVSRELLLEGFDVGTADVAGIEMNLDKVAFHALAHFRGLRSQISEFNLHWTLSC